MSPIKFILCSIGTLLFIVLCYLHSQKKLSERVFESFLQKKLIFTKSSEFDKEFSKPQNIDVKFYLFNCTNHEDVDFGVKPNFETVGPYIYTVTFTTDDKTFNATENSVSFKQKINIVYNEKATNQESLKQIHVNPKTDVIYHANIPAIIYAKVRHVLAPMMETNLVADIFQNTVVAIAETDSNLYAITNTTVQGLLEGYEDSLPKTIKYMVKKAIDMLGDSDTEKQEMKKKIDQFFPDNFGLLNLLNGTVTAPTKVNDGTTNFKNVFKILSVDGNSNLDCWKFKNSNENSNKVNKTQLQIDENNLLTSFDKGETVSNGFFYQPLTDVENPPKKIKVYSPEQSRIINVTYQGKERIQGLPVLEYQYGSDTINSDFNKVLESVCTKKDCKYSKGSVYFNRCLPLPKSIKRFIPPILISNPHFLHGTGNLSNYVDGFKPDPEKHRSFVKFEPTTGVPITIAKRVQINIIAQQTDSVGVKYDHSWNPHFSKIGQNFSRDSTILLPLAYVDIYRHDAEMVKKLYNKLHLSRAFLDNWLLVILFICPTAVIFILHVLKAREKKITGQVKRLTSQIAIHDANEPKKNQASNSTNNKKRPTSLKFKLPDPIDQLRITSPIKNIRRRISTTYTPIHTEQTSMSEMAEGFSNFKKNFMMKSDDAREFLIDENSEGSETPILCEEDNYGEGSIFDNI